MYTRVVDAVEAPDKPVDITLTFKQGLPVKLQVDKKEYTDSLELFETLNKIGGENGIGRIDIVEVRTHQETSESLADLLDEVDWHTVTRSIRKPCYDDPALRPSGCGDIHYGRSCTLST